MRGVPVLRSAAAAAHAAAAAGGTADPGLRRALRRSRRREQWRAAVLVLPLFAFVLVCFVAPIGAMLARGFVDTDIARILPGVTAALRDWDSRELPPETAYAALVRDIHAAREAGTLASAATRLNYDVPGFRTLLFGTGRQLPDETIGIRARRADRHRSEMGGARNLGRAPPRRRSTHRFLPAGRARSSSRRRQPDRRRAGRATGIPQRARPHAVDFGCGHADVPAAGLSGRAGDRAAAAATGGAAAVPRPAAFLDVAARAHGRLGGAAAEGRRAEQPLPVARHRQRAAQDDLQPLRRLRRDGPRAAAVHGAAALQRDARHSAVVPARRFVAGRAAVDRIPPGLPAADDARHRRRAA